MNDGDRAECNECRRDGWFLRGDDDAGTPVPLETNDVVETVREKLRPRTIKHVLILCQQEYCD